MLDVHALATAHPHLHWHTEPGLLAAVSLAMLLYGFAIGPCRRRLAPAAKVTRVQTASFCLALIVLYGAVASPLDAMGETYLFSAHMIQHMLLIYAVPVLLLGGMPGWLLRSCLTLRPVNVMTRWLTRPIVACLLFNINFSIWHIPALYEWGLRDSTVHIIEHGTFLGSALLMWWPLMSRIPEHPPLAPGLQTLYILALALGQIPVFAYLTFASDVLYPTYEAAVRLLPLSPLEDQQLGGMIMKGVSMLVLFIMLAIAFWRWNQDDFADSIIRRRMGNMTQNV